jgi:hypothetical protein
MTENIPLTGHADRQPEIRMKPVVGIAPDAWSADLAAYQLKLMAYHLQLVAGFDELLALEAIDFQPFDYQIRAARTALRRFRGRGLLADEVSTCCARWWRAC